MRWRLSSVLVLVLAVVAARADDKPPAKGSPAAAELKVLEEEYQDAQQKWLTEIQAKRQESLKALQAAKTDDEKKAIQQKMMIRPSDGPGPKFAKRYLVLAQKYPMDPAALDALGKALQTSGGGMVKGGPWPEIVAMLQEKYVAKPEIARFLKPLASSLDESGNKVVRAVMAQNPDHKIQGKACKALAEGLDSAAQVGERLKDNEAMRKNASDQVGKDFIDRLIADVGKSKTEADALRKALKDKYSDVFPDLSEGHAAPEVVSQDLDGKDAKLSALKGKVVMLDIWATWCGPCRGMIPHEREMVDKLKEKPFVLVSVSADEEKKALTDFLVKEKMPWTHWWNGAQGGIVEDWDVQAFPTIYLIDAKGVIRNKFVGSPGNEVLEKAVEKLVTEAEAKK